MLDDMEYDIWCVNNQIPKRVSDYITENIRGSTPARRVASGRKNVIGRYPSTKMGVTIQWESGKLEGPAVLSMEYDKDVLEYYDQPNTIKLTYQNESGQKRGVLYTPDFFVIRGNSAGWVEWKHEDDLEALSKKQPWKFKKDSNGKWHCPPGEEFAKEMGLEFEVCTNRDINWIAIRNLRFLDGYLRREDNLTLDEAKVELLRRDVFKNPGLSLHMLLNLSLSNDYTVDDIYIAMIKKVIHVDLINEILAEPKLVKVYLNEEHRDTHYNLIQSEREMPEASVISIDIGSQILWDNKVWKIVNYGETAVFLQSNDHYNELPKGLFMKLIKDQKIVVESNKSALSDPIADIIIKYDEEDYSIANYRLKFVKIYLRGDKALLQGENIPKLRTIRLWISNYKEAERLYGNGYIGLLPNNKQKGNRSARFTPEVLDFMAKFINEEYETITQKSRAIVYGSFKNACEEKGLMAPSYATFSAYINKRPKEEQTKKRKGKRAAYQVEQLYWELERTVPRHGEFPFNICHLDHTELDIELICSKTGKNLGRPFLSMMVDAFSRRVLAFHVSFEAPSYRSCLMIFRECVRRYNRLPQQLVVDNGKEFHSIYFETFLAMYECEIKWRPAAQPRYGSVLERLFGTTNTKFIHNLKGNTQIMKELRMVTKSVNPKNNAIWTIGNLSKALEVFFFDIYANIEHPSLGDKPKSVFESGLFLSGERKHNIIQYDEAFEILSLPSTKSGQSKVQPSMGIKVHYIYYWCDEFKNPEVENSKVQVRYDPFNIGIVYAYVNKVWIKCISEHYPLLKSLTEKELKYITSEIRRQKKIHSKNYTISAQIIARFIDELDEDTQFELVKLRANESKEAVKHSVSEDSGLKERFNPMAVDEKLKDQTLSQLEDTIESDDSMLDIYGEF